MEFGPLEYVEIEFTGNHFTGEILPELRALRDRNLMRVVDLVFVQKDSRGNVTTHEMSDLSEEEAKQYEPIADDMLRLFTQDDIEALAERVPNDSAAAIALFEHLWAIRLRETIANAKGRVLSNGFVPLADVEALGRELTEQAALSQPTESAQFPS